MEPIPLDIVYDGQWNGLDYVGGTTSCCLVEKDINFRQLVEIIYERTKYDRQNLSFVINAVQKHSEKEPPFKHLIEDDKSVRYLMFDGNKKGFVKVYIDKIVRNFRDGRSTPISAYAPPNISPHVPPHSNPIIPPHSSPYVPPHSPPHAPPYVPLYTPPQTSPLPYQESTSNPHIPEWNGDQGNNDYLPADDPELREHVNSDRDDDVDDRTPVAANVDRDNTNMVSPEIRFSGLQFDYDPSQRYWRVPGADRYRIEEVSTPIPTYERSSIYKGAIFMSKEKLKAAIGLFGLRKKYNLKVRRSCSIRYEVGCRDISCTFELRARCRTGCQMWHVMEFVDEHTCSMDVYESHFRNVKAIVIGYLYSSKLHDREPRATDVIGEMREQHGIQILYSKAWRALEHAKNLCYGKPDESYQQLPSYFHMLKVTNPGTITAIKTDEENRFLFSFFALGASIQGFRSYIRPVIAVDATHLKGDYAGVIFVAACKDGSEMIYPLAFGFGDGERDVSWIWFMSRLREAIGTPEDLIIVSDRHPSIANAMETVFPGVPHGICFFHLKKNLKQHCKKRKDVFNSFYQAAYSHLTSDCDKYLHEIQISHPTTYNALISAGVERWSLAYAPKRRYTMMTTNIAESLNSAMMKARRLPITSAHEFLRQMVQTWFIERRRIAASHTSDITIGAERHINLVHELSLDSRLSPIDNVNTFLVKHDEKGDGVVNLAQKTCTCRKWDLDQLPCLHVVAVARHMRVHYKEFCHQYYSNQWLQAAYAPLINPLMQPADWIIPEEIQSEIVLPPVGRRQPGRPRESRIRSSVEGRPTKKCGKCGQSGHNRVRCTNSLSSSVGECSSSVRQGPRERHRNVCSVCKQPGHNRRRCPEVDHSQPPLETPHEEQDEDNDEGHDQV